MKDLIWDNTLSVEVREIDEDHRKLIDLFNALNRAVIQGQSKSYIEAVLEELISFTVWHFRHEERLMLEHDFTAAAAHKTEHQQLIDSARLLQEKFLQHDTPLSMDDIEFLEQWLTGHILGADMELGSYLGKIM